MLNKSGHTGKFDLVGSNMSNSDVAGTCTPANADPDNEGHPTCLITEAVSGTTRSGCNITKFSDLTSALLSNADKADVVLFHFATNDVWNSIATTKILAAYTTVLGVLRQANPNIVVMVAKIIPMDVTATTCSGCSCPNCNANITALNDGLAGWATTNKLPQSPIIVVDQNTGFTPTPGVDTSDGVHPNRSGSTKIATNWLNALEAYYPVF